MSSLQRWEELDPRADTPHSGHEQSPVIDHERNKDTSTATVFPSTGVGPCSGQGTEILAGIHVQTAEGNKTTKSEADHHLPDSDNSMRS